MTNETPAGKASDVPPPARARVDRQALVAARRTQLGAIRAAARSQLADRQQRRRELSTALQAIRQGLMDFRGQVRMRLREISRESATKRGAPPRTGPRTTPRDGTSTGD